MSSTNQSPSPVPTYRIGDLVWSPWSSVLWPAMITYDPHQAIYYYTSSDDVTHYHIQYFGIVPQRGWVMVKNVRSVKSLDENGSAKPLKKKLWHDFKVAMAELTKASSLDVKQRKLTFIFNYNHLPDKSKHKKVGVAKKVGREKKASVSKQNDGPTEVAMVTQSPEVAVVTIKPAEEIRPAHVINVSPRTSTKYSLRARVRLSRRKIDALKTSSPLSAIGNIDPVITTGDQLLASSGDQLTVTGNTNGVQSLATDNSTVDQLSAISDSNGVQLSATSDSTVDQLSATGDSNGVQLLATDNSTVDQLSPTGDSDDVATDTFPLPPCTQNLLTPPSTGSEADSMDVDISTSKKGCHKGSSKSKEFSKSRNNNSRYHSLLPFPLLKVCSICDNPDKLFTCNGHCFRSFHIDCLGIISFPTSSSFVCDECLISPTVCFVCKKQGEGEGEGDGDCLIACSRSGCMKHYHLSCVRSYETFKLKSAEENSLECGLHTCAKCTCMGVESGCSQKLIRCIACPMALHRTTCLIAGCEIINDTSMICYQHLFLSPSLPQSVRHFNMNCCLHCGNVGSLICCDFCSAAFHIQCLPDEDQSGCGQDIWFCPYCANHDLPTYGSVVMVKCGAYRWWPAEIISPGAVPDFLRTSKLTQCMFLVRFFASKQYFWTHHGRVIGFTEECGAFITSDKNIKQSPAVYIQAFEEALVAHRERKLKLEESKPVQRESKSFIHIKRNRYLVSHSLVEREETEPCKCTEADPCNSSSNCINRAVYVECSKNCPTGQKCQNHRILHNQVAPTDTFHTGGRGWGLKTKRPLAPGDFVVEYIGEVVDKAIVQERLKMAQEAAVSSYYFLTLERNLIIDASTKSNHARFINHSCDPNCETQKWTVNGETRIGIFAIKEVPIGIELTFDYRLDSLGNDKKQCLCGSSNCSGFLGERPKQEKVLPFAKGGKRGNTSLRSRPSLRKGKRKKVISPLTQLPHSMSNDTKGTVMKRKRQVSKEEGSNGEQRKKTKRSNDDPYDDECFNCGEGGDLMLCDYPCCCKVYHLSCTDLKSLPDGEFICERHTCSVCGGTTEGLHHQCPSCPHESHQVDRLRLTGSTRSLDCLDSSSS